MNDDLAKRRDAVTIPTIWIAVAISLLLHLAILGFLLWEDNKTEFAPPEENAVEVITEPPPPPPEEEKKEEEKKEEEKKQEEKKPPPPRVRPTALGKKAASNGCSTP